MENHNFPPYCTHARKIIQLTEKQQEMVVFWPISVCKSSTHTTYIAQHHRICVIKAPKFTSCPPNIFCVFRNVVARRPGSEETPTPPRVVMQRQKQLVSESVTHLRCPRILNARTRVRRAGHIGLCENIHTKCRWILQKRKVAKKDQETVKNLADVWIDFISVGYHAHLWIKVVSLSFTPLGVHSLYWTHTF